MTTIEIPSLKRDKREIFIGASIDELDLVFVFNDERIDLVEVFETRHRLQDAIKALKGLRDCAAWAYDHEVISRYSHYEDGDQKEKLLGDAIDAADVELGRQGK